MITTAGPESYALARRMVAQGVPIEDAARRAGFGAEGLRILIERERVADLRAWQTLGERGVAR